MKLGFGGSIRRRDLELILLVGTGQRVGLELNSTELKAGDLIQPGAL